MFVINTSDRPESFAVQGRKQIKFPPGRTEITEQEYFDLIAKIGHKPSWFSWFLEEGKLTIEGDIPDPPVEPEVEEDKAVAKAKEKLKEAEETAAKKKQAEAEAAAKKKRAAESKAVREEINSLLRKKGRSMKYDDLAEDYKVERDDIKVLVSVKDLEASKLFCQWLASEVE